MKPVPNSVIGLIEELERNNPARCIQPAEDLHAHLRYAGRVELVAELRGRYEAELRINKKSLPTVL